MSQLCQHPITVTITVVPQRCHSHFTLKTLVAVPPSYPGPDPVLHLCANILCSSKPCDARRHTDVGYFFLIFLHVWKCAGHRAMKPLRAECIYIWQQPATVICSTVSNKGHRQNFTVFCLSLDSEAAVFFFSSCMRWREVYSDDWSSMLMIYGTERPCGRRSRGPVCSETDGLLARVTHIHYILYTIH